MNDFKTDLKYSLEERENEMFDLFYFRVFPKLSRIETIENLKLQKQGIDKILHFYSGKKLLIDEKKRRKDYGDILIEEYSDFDNKKPGWLHNSKYTDYIVYAIMPSKIIYLLPFQLLYMAVCKYYKQWLKEYHRIFAPNEGYRTSNIPVPVTVLINAIKEQMQKSFIPVERSLF